MLAWRFIARKLHARPQPDSGRRCIKCTEVATETHKRPLSVTRCLFPATTLVNVNSDDKPRRLPLYMNSLGSCLSYEPRGIAPVTVNGISRSSGSLTIVYGSDEICRRPATAGTDDRRGVEYVYSSPGSSSCWLICNLL